MKRIGKPVFFIVAAFILIFTTIAFTGISSTYGDITTTYIKGVGDIRWGIDIRGGVDVTFTPSTDVTPTELQMEAAAETMRQRLVSLNITDYEVYTDTQKGRVVVRFPWREDETEFDPQAAIQELGATALLTFREGSETDDEGKPTGVTADIQIEGKNVVQAEALYGPISETSGNVYYISLEFDDEGAQAFSDLTTRLASENGSISIWMDDEMISNATVNEAITDGRAIISGNFTHDSATELANKINAGALPFQMEAETYSATSPTLGQGALNAMLIAGILAFTLICILMLVLYRVQGIIICIALIGQVGGMIASVSGFIPGINSFTMTIPGIAGMILSIGMGVDANVITAERIKEELHNGKSIDGAVQAGFTRGFSAIFDGNITNIIVAIILMGAFGSADNIFSKILTPIFGYFGYATEGSVFSFGYTLLVGVVLNFLFGVLATRLMTKSLSRFKWFRKPSLYGGGFKK